MEFLIILVLIGMVIYLLPYIIAGALMLIGLTGLFFAWIYILLEKLFKRF